MEEIRRKYRLPEEYILHVGRIDRKKNLPLLIKAFAIFQKINSFKGKLVLVGEEYRKSRDTTLHALIDNLSLRDQVVFTRVVPDSDLPAIFGAALITVFCSRHEGFGIVALEAMASGAPLIITPAGAVLEAAGDAALILEEEDPNLLADVMSKVVADPILQMSLRQKGLERAARFSWRSAAEQTLHLYEEVVLC
jgi:glycosyltransferase involved in cell wall biosynthesis